MVLSSCASVGEWLRAIKMERYEDSFLQAGLATVEQLGQITTESVPIYVCFCRGVSRLLNIFFQLLN